MTTVCTNSNKSQEYNGVLAQIDKNPSINKEDRISDEITDNISINSALLSIGNELIDIKVEDEENDSCHKVDEHITNSINFHESISNCYDSNQGTCNDLNVQNEFIDNNVTIVSNILQNTADISNLTSSEENQNLGNELECLKVALQQKDNTITLIKRENYLLEMEKESFRKEKEKANKEKESIVIKFATKEKLLLDAKKEKELVEKQLCNAHKEIKNCTLRLNALNEDKSRVAYMMDEKNIELRKCQRDYEKLNTDYSHLESKFKYYVNKLNIESEAKQALEKKLEEERNAPHKLEEKAYEKLKMEFDAQTILMKHEISRKSEHLDKLVSETEIQRQCILRLQEQLEKSQTEKTEMKKSLISLQAEHNDLQNSYSTELLNAAKLRGQLEEFQVLKTQNALNKEKIAGLSVELSDALDRVLECESELQIKREKESDLLNSNREISESIVTLQNELCLLKAKTQGLESENTLLKNEKVQLDTKYKSLENDFLEERKQKNEDRLILTKHLSEKTKLCEITSMRLENAMGDLQASKRKNTTIVRELQREIFKYKKLLDEKNAKIDEKIIIPEKQQSLKVQENSIASIDKNTQHGQKYEPKIYEVHKASSLKCTDSSESETCSPHVHFKLDEFKTPSKKLLIERILRLQQASARQNDKIDFLENHTFSLVDELRKKSQVIQYYMLRDQTGALTTPKSDQNKNELLKYGDGVMSAIYGGMKSVEKKNMTLDLSLEINKKLQAVLEDTLLKNITLKENLDVLGLEVDKLTQKLRKLETKGL